MECPFLIHAFSNCLSQQRGKTKSQTEGFQAHGLSYQSSSVNTLYEVGTIHAQLILLGEVVNRPQTTWYIQLLTLK